MLEYLDAILRKGVARLPAVAERLRANARHLGLDPERLGGDLDTAMRDALRLGAEDILLDQLLDLVGRTPADLAALQQAAAFARPVNAHGLAFALAGGSPPATRSRPRRRAPAASSGPPSSHPCRRTCSGCTVGPPRNSRTAWTRPCSGSAPGAPASTAPGV